MSVDINIKYSLKETGDGKYLLSIKGNMRWVSGFVLFMAFTTLLTAAFFLPMGYSVKSYLKLVIPVFLIFTAIAVIAAYVFKKKSEKTFIFDKQSNTIIQPHKTETSNWEKINLPQKAILVRDSYKYLSSNLLLSTVSMDDSVYQRIVSINRLMLIPLAKNSSAEDVLKNISLYEKNLMNNTYAPNDKPPLPEGAILLSDGGFSEYQDLIIEGFIKLFDWEFIDFLTSPPEIYDKEKMNKVSLDKALENIEKPKRKRGLKEKIRSNKTAFTINGIPFYLKLIVLFFMAVLSAFYAFFASIKNDTDFLLAFTPMFSVWFLVLSLKTKLYITKKEVYKRLTIFGIPLTPKQSIALSDIGDIKIKKENTFDVIFYNRNGRQTILSLPVPYKETGEYIIYRIVEFIKRVYIR